MFSIIFILFLSLPSISSTPLTQILALQSLYNLTQGDQWIWKNEILFGSKWSFQSSQQDPCNDQTNRAWQGITCSSPPNLCKIQECFINSIILNDYGLNGTLPSDIFPSLTSLTSFEISASPKLHGAIPSTLSSLIYLEDLDFGINGLTGTISTSFGNLVSLTSLFLGANNLKGSIPSEMGYLSNLQYLNLDRNLLSKSIPSEIGYLSSLQECNLNVNFLSNSLPTEIGFLVNLQVFRVYRNSLNSFIPSEIGYLSNLQELRLDRNAFTKSIPSEIGCLTNLQELYLYINLLSNSIPSEIGYLTNIRVIYLNENPLTSSIPSEIGYLSKLELLYLYRSLLSGSIPPEIGNLTNLQALTLDHNVFTNSIPSEIGHLSGLRALTLDHNSLSRSIPSEIGALTSLLILFLNENSLSSSIPSNIGSMSRLMEFHIFGNHITGKMPTAFYNLKNLLVLELSYNQLSGSISPSIGSFARLTLLFLDHNGFTNSIPSEIGGLQNLQYFDMTSNFFTGPLPSSVGLLLELQYLYISENSFSNSISSELGLLTNLVDLWLSENKFTGSIPLLSNLTNLVRLHLFQNHLTGSITFSLLSFPSLQQLFIQMNQLTGNLHQLLPAASQSSTLSSVLINFDVSDNRFSGSLPSSLFLLPQLQSISLSLNCFEDSLPLSICEAKNITTISMDGLGTSEGCKNTVIFRFITSVTLGQTIDGSIPECIWLLSTLQTLNLAGNALTGRIGEIAEMPALSSMTLSHNYLSGYIPLWLQEKNITSLDLSHNKLSGDVGGFKNQAKILNSVRSKLSERILKLSVNRLSGDLSDSFNIYSTLDILIGNLFSCKDIPSGDKNGKWTSCGSKELDQTMFAMGGVLGWLLLLVLFYGIGWLISFFSSKNSLLSSSASDIDGNYGRNKTLTWLKSRLINLDLMVQNMRYFSVDNEIDLKKEGEHHRSHQIMKSITSFGYFLSNLVKSICILNLIAFILSLPIYLLKEMNVDSTDPEDDDLKYITHSHMYRWLWTMAFLSGSTPAIILLIVTLICLMFFSLMLHQVIDKNDGSLETLKSQLPLPQLRSSEVCASKNPSLIYRDSISGTEMKNSFDEIQTRLSVIVWIIFIFNIGVVGTVNGLYLWSTLIELHSNLRILIQVGFGFFSFVWNVVILRGSMSSRIKESKYGLWLFNCLVLMNSVVIPCIATALSSPNCYQRLLIPPDEVSSSYTYRYCSLFISTRAEFSCLSYSRGMMDSLKFLPPFTYSYQCGSTLLTAYLPVYMYSISLQILTTFLKLVIIFSSHRIKYPNWLIKKFVGICWPDNWDQQTSPPNSSPDMIRPYQILSSTMNNMILFLSFGLCSAVLSWYITISICLNLCCWLMLIGRFLSRKLSNEQNIQPRDSYLDVYLTLLNEQLTGIQSSITVCKWPIICTSCCFITLLCWDMVGDQVGWYRGLWVPITGCGMVLVIWRWDRILQHGWLDKYLLSFACISFFSSPSLSSSSSLQSNSVEMMRSSSVSILHLPHPPPSSSSSSTDL